MILTTIHFDRTTDDNVRVTVVDHDAVYLVYVADLDVAEVVGRKTFAHLDQALAYARAAADGVVPAGTFVNI